MSSSSEQEDSAGRSHLINDTSSVLSYSTGNNNNNLEEQVIQQPTRIDYGAFMSTTTTNNNRNTTSMEKGEDHQNVIIEEHDVQFDNNSKASSSGVTPRNLTSPNSASLRDRVSNITGMFTNRIASFKRKNVVPQSDHEDNSLLPSSNVNNGNAYYLAPLPKCDWEVNTPTKLGDMYDDVFNYMFMFMPPNQLVKVGSISKRFRDLSSKDDIWSPIYNSFDFEVVEKDPSINTGFRTEFIKKLHEKNTLTKRRKYAEEELPYSTIKQACFQVSYGFIAPQLFLTSFLIFLILVPLIMDDFINISMVGYCTLPFFFALGCFAFLTYCLIMDPFYLHPKRKKLIDIIPNNTNSKFWALNPEEKHADDGIRDSINLYVWHLWIWLLFILMFITKYIWFATLSAPFTALFVPCYIFSISYCIFPLTFYCCRKSDDISSESKYLFKCSYFTNSVTVTVSAIQILLIGLKLDNIITTYWNVVLIPAWIFLLFVNCMCCWYVGCAAFSDSSLNICYSTFGVASQCAFGLFYQVWFIIFALRLDSIFIALYTPLFVPLWLFILVVGGCHCLCGGGALVYRFFDLATGPQVHN